MEGTDGAGWSENSQTRPWYWVPGSAEGKDDITFSLLRTQKKGFRDSFRKQELFGLKVRGQDITVL